MNQSAEKTVTIEQLPGIFNSIDIDDYHSGPGISNTGLSHIARSPAHFYALHLDPARPPEKERAGQLTGQLVHCAILEPDEFDKRYILGPTANRSTKVWKEFCASFPDQVAIQQDQYDMARYAAESARKLPEIAETLAAGEAEQSAYWIDPETGVLCRCRPDWTHTFGAGVVLMDVKTYSDASPAEFARQVARKSYHRQAAFYSDGYALASGQAVHAFVFLAVETEWPYAVSATMLDDEAVEKGRELYRDNLATYAECLKTGVWPGYSNAIDTISLPAWALG